MEHYATYYITQIEKFFAPLALALFGVLASYAVSKEKWSLDTLISHMITGTFAGLMVFYLVQDMGLAPGLEGFIIGITGYTAKRALVLMEMWFLKTFEITINKKGIQPTPPNEEKSNGEKPGQTVAGGTAGQSEQSSPPPQKKKARKTEEDEE